VVQPAALYRGDLHYTFLLDPQREKDSDCKLLYLEPHVADL